MSDQVDGWLSRNISPALALVTVILTFFMFGFFIYIIMNPPNDEIRAVSSAEQKYETARIDSTRQATVNKLHVKSSKIDSTRQKGEEVLKEDTAVLKHKVGYAKTA